MFDNPSDAIKFPLLACVTSLSLAVLNLFICLPLLVVYLMPSKFPFPAESGGMNVNSKQAMDGYGYSIF